MPGSFHYQLFQVVRILFHHVNYVIKDVGFPVERNSKKEKKTVNKPEKDFLPVLLYEVFISIFFSISFPALISSTVATCGLCDYFLRIKVFVVVVVAAAAAAAAVVVVVIVVVLPLPPTNCIYNFHFPKRLGETLPTQRKLLPTVTL